MCLDWNPRRYLFWYWAMSSGPISTLDLWLRTSERHLSSVLFCSFAVVARIYRSCSFAVVVPCMFWYGNVIQELCKLRQCCSRNLWAKGTFPTHLEDMFCYATVMVVSFQVVFLTNLDSHDLLKLFLASGADVSIVVLLFLVSTMSCEFCTFHRKEDSWSEIRGSDPSEVSDLKIQRECLRLVNGKEKPHFNHVSARQLPLCWMVIREKVNNLLCVFPVSASSLGEAEVQTWDVRGEGCT